MDNVNLEVMKRVEAAEAQLRRKTGKEKGKMGLGREHVLAMIHSNADAQTIGKPRGDIVWMPGDDGTDSNQEASERRHVLQTGTHKAAESEGTCNDYAAMGQEPTGTAHKVELVQSVSAWLKENEEQEGGVYVIRPGKWNQLKSALKKLAAKRGGVDALIATITLLSAKGKATTQQRPNKPTNKGRWDDWVEDSVKWMVQHEWLTAEEAVGLSAKALSTAQQNEVSKDTFPERVHAGRSETVRRGEKRSGDTTRVAREAHIPCVHSRKSSRPRAGDPSRGARNTAEEQGLGHQGGRQVCIRAGGVETGEAPHGQTSVGAKGEDRERQVQCRAVHREAGEERQDRTPETDAGELEGEESGLREEERGRREWTVKAVANAIERELIEEAYPIIMKSPGSSPVAGSKRTTTTRDKEEGEVREKPEETALKRQTRKGRTREGGTQGGKTTGMTERRSKAIVFIRTADGGPPANFP